MKNVMQEAVTVILNGSENVVFGGFVRDTLRNVEPKDIDVISLDVPGLLMSFLNSGFSLSKREITVDEVNEVNEADDSYTASNLTIHRITVSKGGDSVDVDIVCGDSRTIKLLPDANINRMVLRKTAGLRRVEDSISMLPDSGSLIHALMDVNSTRVMVPYNTSERRIAKLVEKGYKVHVNDMGYNHSMAELRAAAAARNESFDLS